MCENFVLCQNSSSLTALLQNGEIDIIEGVHDNQHNQVAWHTSPGCTLDTSAKFTGNITVSLFFGSSSRYQCGLRRLLVGYPIRSGTLSSIAILVAVSQNGVERHMVLTSTPNLDAFSRWSGMKTIFQCVRVYIPFLKILSNDWVFRVVLSCCHPQGYHYGRSKPIWMGCAFSQISFFEVWDPKVFCEPFNYIRFVSRSYLILLKNTNCPLQTLPFVVRQFVGEFVCKVWLWRRWLGREFICYLRMSWNMRR